MNQKHIKQLGSHYQHPAFATKLEVLAAKKVELIYSSVKVYPSTSAAISPAI